MLIASIGTFILSKKLTTVNPVEEGEGAAIVDKIHKKRVLFLTNIGNS